MSALAEIGELARARELCEKLLSLASPLALYAEQLDAATGRHLGNFPQAFTHLALINAVVHIVHDEEQLELRALDREPELDRLGGRPSSEAWAADNRRPQGEGRAARAK